MANKPIIPVRDDLLAAPPLLIRYATSEIGGTAASMSKCEIQCGRKQMKQQQSGSYEKARAAIERSIRENAIRKKAAEGRRWQQERERRRCALTMTEFAAKYGRG